MGSDRGTGGGTKVCLSTLVSVSIPISGDKSVLLLLVQWGTFIKERCMPCF